MREGLLVTLTEEGAVAVTFLGTRPTLFSAAPPDSREVTQQINNIRHVLKNICSSAAR